RPRSRLSCDVADFDDALENLRHFIFEEPTDELRVGPREDELGAPLTLVYFDEESADRIADFESIAVDHLAVRNDRLGLADLDDDAAPIHLGDGARDHLVGLVGVLII